MKPHKLTDFFTSTTYLNDPTVYALGNVLVSVKGGLKAAATGWVKVAYIDTTKYTLLQSSNAAATNGEMCTQVMAESNYIQRYCTSNSVAYSFQLIIACSRK